MLPQIIKTVGKLRVHAVPVFSDNYSYVIEHIASQKALAVDPAEADKVVDYINSVSLSLVGSLTTHIHADHAGGNKDVAKMFPDIPIYGSSIEVPPACNSLVKGGERITPFDDADVSIVISDALCHTKGHILFGFEQPSLPSLLFTGDTLFLGGCGRFFFGNGHDMTRIIDGPLLGYPDDTLVFCGHEYTISNLRFASAVEPSNPHIAEAKSAYEALLAAGKPTVPGTMAVERKTNPFLRIDQVDVINFALRHPAAADLNLTEETKTDRGLVMSVVRKAKDTF